MNKVEQLIAHLGRELGVEDFAPDADGFCALPLAEGWLCLFWHQEKDCLRLYTKVAVAGEEGFSRETLELALSANLFGGGLDDLRLGYFAQARTLMLWCEIPISTLNGADLCQAAALLVIHADTWRNKLTAQPDPAPATEAVHWEQPGMIPV